VDDLEVELEVKSRNLELLENRLRRSNAAPKVTEVSCVIHHCLLYCVFFVFFRRNF